MAVRVADIIKFMMRQGQMLKQSDELDADTAELIATEHGPHRQARGGIRRRRGPLGRQSTRTSTWSRARRS